MNAEMRAPTVVIWVVVHPEKSAALAEVKIEAVWAHVGGNAVVSLCLLTKIRPPWGGLRWAFVCETSYPPSVATTNISPDVVGYA